MKKIIIIVMAMMPFMYSCNDSYMERLPRTEIGVENFFNTEEDLRMYAYGLYDFPTAWQYTADAGTDNQAITAQVEVKSLMASANPTSATVTGGWNWKRLRDINILLENVSKAKVAPDVIAHYEGLGKFFRARFYMEKVQRYSDVPWIDKPLKTDDQLLYGKRDSRDFVIGKIFEDYAFAAKNIKINQPKGSIDKWVALAYMSRDALYEGTFRKYHPELKLTSTADTYLKTARDAAKQIIDGQKFSIYNTGKPQTDYISLFTSYDLSTNPEIILARFYDTKQYRAGHWAAAFGSYESCPTKDMLQSYLMNDGSYYSSQSDWKTKLFVDEFKDRDLRLWQTYAYPGWVLVNTSTYAPGGGLYVQSLSKNFSGYHLIKGFVNDKSKEANDDIDYPVLRYAEVLLNYAEAKAELNELSPSDLDISINLLRKRVGMPNFNINPIADPEMQNKFTGISPLLLEVRRERRVELAFEGFRFNDLMRWHAGKLIENEPEGIYFPDLGKYDMTGDGIPDIFLIPSTDPIPADANQETNSLGKKLIYYKTGDIDDSKATVYLKNKTSGNIQTIKNMGTFVEPKYYYRPIPEQELKLNPNLGPQLFGWE